MSGAALRSERFEERETWPSERVEEFQLRKLKRLLGWAHRELPFYRQRFDRAGFHPDGLRSWGDFRRVPVFTKGDVLRAMEAGQHFTVGMETGDPAVIAATSGTLGTTFLSLSRRWREAMGEALVRAYRWAGFLPGMRAMTAAPAWHALSVKESYALRRLGATASVPWGTLLPRFSGALLDALLDLRPQFVSVFLPLLYALLAECARRGMPPVEVFRSATTLLILGAPLTPRSREVLKDELGVGEIFEGLGSSEGLVAMECAVHRGHHLFVDTCYMEVVDPLSHEPLPPGTRGSVVLTSLVPHGSVHIRYDTGDVGEMFPDACPCGRTWPRLKIYDRWVNAFVVAGRERVPYDVRLCLDEVPELRGIPFAVIRDEGDMPRLRLAIETPAGVEALGGTLDAVLNGRLGVKAEVEWVEELPTRWKGMPVIAARDWGVSHG